MRRLADENFNNDILRALFRGKPEIDVVRAQDAGLTGIDDAALLAWAAEHHRVLLTHDVSTITAHAYRRVMQGEPMPGVFEVSCDLWLRTAVDDILLVTECSRRQFAHVVEYTSRRARPGERCTAGAFSPDCSGPISERLEESMTCHANQGVPAVSIMVRQALQNAGAFPSVWPV